MESIQWTRYQQVASIDWACSWLTMQNNLGLARATIDAYVRFNIILPFVSTRTLSQKPPNGKILPATSIT
jgi:hypothetical protein